MRTDILLLILGMLVVVGGPRALPAAILSRFDMPERLLEWLSYIAPAVLSALLILSILAPAGKIWFGIDNPYLIAFLPSLFVALWTRNLFFTLGAGMLAMAVLQMF
ncbi:MAG: AzlD domain-containing protein [Solirubrobacterales bacterium]